MSSNKSHKLQFGPQSQSRKPGSSHKGSNLQKWNVIDMQNALVFYFSVRAPGYTGRKYGYKAVADAYSVPRETFRRRLSGPLKGYFGHVAGGRMSQKKFVSVSHPSILLTPITLALPNNLVTPVIIPPPQPPLPAVAPGRAPPPAAAGRAPVPDEESGKQIYLPLVFHFLFITCRHFE